MSGNWVMGKLRIDKMPNSTMKRDMTSESTGRCMNIFSMI